MQREIAMQNYQQYRETISRVNQDPPILLIEKTASRLEGMNFSPTLLFPIQNFLRITRNRLLEEFDHTCSLERSELLEMGMPEKEDEELYKDKQLSLMAYWYNLLNQLRRDVPEAWDEINELYEDD